MGTSSLTAKLAIVSAFVAIVLAGLALAAPTGDINTLLSDNEHHPNTSMQGRVLRHIISVLIIIHYFAWYFKTNFLIADLKVREERNTPNFIDDCHLTRRPYDRHPKYADPQYKCCFCIQGTTKCANETGAYDPCNITNLGGFDYNNCCARVAPSEDISDTLSDNEQLSPSSTNTTSSSM